MSDTKMQDTLEYAENILETVRESLLVLNSELKVISANRSFYDTFKGKREETIGNFLFGHLYDLQKILGHTQYEMTQIYAHLSPEHLSGTTQILSFGSDFSDVKNRSKNLVVMSLCNFLISKKKKAMLQRPFFLFGAQDWT